VTPAVVDASAVLAWLLPGQATQASRAFQRRIPDFALEAPFVFEWEVQNVLLRTLGRDLALLPLYRSTVEQLAELDVALSAPFQPSEVLSRAIRARLSLFDACYLERAQRRGLALISRDKALVAAATAHGVVAHDLT
jgi:predicted nucleic acid-binding protein